MPDKEDRLDNITGWEDIQWDDDEHSHSNILHRMISESDQVAEKMAATAIIFHRYRGALVEQGLPDNVADQMAVDFHRAWWDNILNAVTVAAIMQMGGDD